MFIYKLIQLFKLYNNCIFNKIVYAKKNKNKKILEAKHNKIKKHLSNIIKIIYVNFQLYYIN